MIGSRSATSKRLMGAVPIEVKGGDLPFLEREGPARDVAVA